MFFSMFHFLESYHFFFHGVGFFLSVGLFWRPSVLHMLSFGGVLLNIGLCSVESGKGGGIPLRCEWGERRGVGYTEFCAYVVYLWWVWGLVPVSTCVAGFGVDR